jgi:hypothetical protein
MGVDETGLKFEYRNVIDSHDAGIEAVAAIGHSVKTVGQPHGICLLLEL